jgi:SAM-dependent methyltransferase
MTSLFHAECQCRGVAEVRRWAKDMTNQLLAEIWIMKRLRTVLAIGVGVAILELSYACSAETNTPPVRSSIPYLATRNDAVRDMLWMANVGKDDVVYDLGSGDGRIVIAAVRDFGARRAVGIEIDPEHIRESRENAHKAEVTDQVEFISGDLFTNDFRQASVVTLFLGHEPNIKLRPRILSMLKPGTRVVSHQFGMGEWQADKSLTVRTVFLGMWGEGGNRFRDNPRVPDYTGNEMHYGTSDKISMWVVPAQIAGIWRGKIETAQGPRDCQLALHQRLSAVTGTFQLAGQTNQPGVVRSDVWGDHVRFECMGYDQSELRFDGHVHDNTMQGTLAMTDHGQLLERAWEARRDKADFAGTWEWPCASGPRSVRLCIERRDGHLMATYLDRDQTMPVTDFYDCGGGFYFTLLIGRGGDSFTINKDTGWLIGEGVLGHGALKGKIEFHPYEDMAGAPDGKKASQPVVQDWTPCLIKP